MRCYSIPEDAAEKATSAIMKAKITGRLVTSVEPDRKDVFVWDTEVIGFGLKVTPKGKRIYVLQYRLGGRVRRYTIGRHGSPWSATEARNKAKWLLRLAAQGTDPAEVRPGATRKRAPEELWDELAKTVGSESGTGEAHYPRRQPKKKIAKTTEPAKPTGLRGLFRFRSR